MCERKREGEGEEKERERERHTEDLKDLDTLYRPFLNPYCDSIFRFRASCLFFFDETSSNGLRQGATLPPAATLGLQDPRLLTEDLTDDWRLTVTAVGCCLSLWRRSAGALCNRPLPLDWLLLCRYQCIYNFIMPMHFRLNPRELLTLMHLCLLVHTGASFNDFVYTSGPSGSVESQYAAVALGAIILCAALRLSCFWCSDMTCYIGSNHVLSRLTYD